MKIICPNCKSENLLGAVFCRACGHKIVAETMQPGDVQLTMERTNWARVRYWVGETLIFLVTLTLIIMALTEEDFKATPDPVKKQAGRWGDWMKTCCTQGASYDGLTEDQLNAGIIGLLGLDKNPSIEIPNSGMWLQAANVNLEKSRLTAVFRLKSFGVTYDFVVKMFIFQQPGKPPTFLVDSARMGKLPLPGPMRKLIVSRAETILDLDKSGTLSYLGQAYAYRSCTVNKDSVSIGLNQRKSD